MSMLIKGLNMPKKGLMEIIISPDGICYELERPLIDTEHAEVSKHHEAVHIPDHGDLIDRSRLIGGFADWYIQESPMYLGDSKVVAETIGDAMKAIEAAPVVIPAERSEE